MITTLFPNIGRCDWTDLPAVTAVCDKVLTALDTDRSQMRRLVVAAAVDPGLTRLWEHYDILDKLVLHDDPTGWRLRLHIFLPGYYDRPHNHRWTYASRILTGSYTHTLYGTDDQLTDTIDVAALQPRMVRTETAGDFYTLHHSMIHSVVAAPHTVSLVVRGPAVTDRFVVTDRVTGRAWWQYGAAVEDPTEAAAKRMTPQQITASVGLLTDHQVLR